MARLDSILHNFDRHLRRGFSRLTAAAYASVEAGGASPVIVELLEQAPPSMHPGLATEIPGKAKTYRDRR